MAATYITLQNLKTYDGKVKSFVGTETAKAIKGYLKVDNAWNFYTEENPTAESVPAFSIDVPTEYFLDQTKTTFVQEFAYSAELYAGSTDPNLEGKPVWVMAVKGDNDTVTYSFVNLETLVDIYTGAETDTITVAVSEDNVISAEVKVSAAEGNIITVNEDGLYATVEPTDISGKADKLIEEAVKEAQILVDDGTGNLEASGITIEELKATVTEEVMANFDMETDVDAEINSWFE
jgi:hypothetical protein